MYKGGRSKGFVPSQESRDQARASNPNKKKVSTPEGVFNSLSEAARHFGLHAYQVSYYCKMGDKLKSGWVAKNKPQIDFSGWGFVGDIKHKPIKRRVRTPLGEFNSVAEAAKAHGISSSAICHVLKNGKDGYEYID